MRPLIVAATHEEIKASIPYLEQHQIPYLLTGVGMVATTFALTQSLSTQKYDTIINVGIAGAIDKSLKIGDVVEIYEDIFSELGAQDGDSFLSIEQLGFGKSVFCKLESDLLKTDLLTNTGITVNTIHGSNDAIAGLKKQFPNAATESMEGAAVFYVASQLNIPSIQVRAISNYVEKRDKTTWNIPLAIKNLNNWLVSFLNRSLESQKSLSKNDNQLN